MGTRQAKVLNTKKKLIEALGRLKNGTYTNRKLKSKKVVKVNAYNVEIEAGSSIGTLRNHPEIKDEIDNYEPNAANAENVNPTLSEKKLLKAVTANKELKAQLSKVKSELKRVKEESKVISEKLDRQIVEEHELIVALMANVNIHECKIIFKKQPSHLTVVKHDFKS